MKKWPACLAAVWPVWCAAQTPDALVKVDFHMVFSGGPQRSTVFRSYDLHGTHSTIGLNLTLEPGYLAVITQRLQRIPGDADSEQLDESYLEDPGYWRAGKQYLPFGTGRLLYESATAGRIDLRVGGDQVPASFAACDGRKGTTRGFSGRVGGNIGVSFAFGDNFGVSATSLANLRGPDGSPGVGRGWGRVVGADYTTRRQHWTASLEVARFSKGASSLDRDQTVFDLAFTLSRSADRSVSFGWCKVWGTGNEVFRIEAKQPLATSLWLEPMLRLKDGRVMDAGLSLHVKL